MEIETLRGEEATEEAKEKMKELISEIETDTIYPYANSDGKIEVMAVTEDKVEKVAFLTSEESMIVSNLFEDAAREVAIKAPR